MTDMTDMTNMTVVTNNTNMIDMTYKANMIDMTNLTAMTNMTQHDQDVRQARPTWTMTNLSKMTEGHLRTSQTTSFVTTFQYDSF